MVVMLMENLLYVGLQGYGINGMIKLCDVQRNTFHIYHGSIYVQGLEIAEKHKLKI